MTDHGGAAAFYRRLRQSTFIEPLGICTRTTAKADILQDIYRVMSSKQAIYDLQHEQTPETSIEYTPSQSELSSTTLPKSKFPMTVRSVRAKGLIADYNFVDRYLHGECYISYSLPGGTFIHVCINESLDEARQNTFLWAPTSPCRD